MNPVGLAAWLAGQNWDEILRAAFFKRGTTPDELFRLTPHRLFALFFNVAPTEKTVADPVGLLRLHNEGRARQGLPPVLPSWFWKSRRRKR